MTTTTTVSIMWYNWNYNCVLFKVFKFVFGLVSHCDKANVHIGYRGQHLAIATQMKNWRIHNTVFVLLINRTLKLWWRHDIFVIFQVRTSLVILLVFIFQVPLHQLYYCCLTSRYHYISYIVIANFQVSSIPVILLFFNFWTEVLQLYCCFLTSGQKCCSYIVVF